MNSVRRVALSPIGAVYGAALAVKNLAYDRHWMPQQQLEWPVVSIGNLSVGGAGKTPFVAELARLLSERSISVDVLSRGYGRRSEATLERVLPEEEDGAARFGDEPLLLARGTGVPIYVGASRYRAGLLAESGSSAVPATRDVFDGDAGGWPGHVHLLDDGFQHRQLHRTVDLVLLHPRDTEDALLPGGHLRESLTALRRADCLLLREDDATTKRALERTAIAKPIWRVRRSVQVPQGCGRVVAFAAIAHPGEFFAALRSEGVAVRKTFAFRDHHRFTAQDLRMLVEAAQAEKAILLTTEKDLLRLPERERGWVSTRSKLLAVPLRVTLLHAEACLTALRAWLSRGPVVPGVRGNAASTTMRK